MSAPDRSNGHAEKHGPAAAPTSAIERIWRPCSASVLDVAPPARQYLLRHPDQDGRPCADGHGDGLLPLGKVGMLASAGGVGKTFILVALAIAVITGRRWLGWYHVDRLVRGRRVLLALGEEDREEAERRLYDVGRAYELDTEERELVAERLMLLPLHGEQVSLVTYGPDGRTLVDSPELIALRALLHSAAGDEGWGLISADPLSRFAGGDTEKDNFLATAFIQRLETLTRVPGRPTVLASHHSNQASREAEAEPKPRGVSALEDGSRWVATIRRTAAGAAFRQRKSNYSRHMADELELRYEPRSGLLRVATEEEIREQKEDTEIKANAREAKKEAQKDDRAEAGIIAAVERVLAALRAAPAAVTSESALVALAGGNKTKTELAVRRLKASGRLAKEPGNRGALYLANESRPQSPPSRPQVAPGGGSECPRVTPAPSTIGVRGDDGHTQSGKPDPEKATAERVTPRSQNGRRTL